jgi:elongation factor G
MSISTGQIRNVVLVGHNGTGKTTLAEALLVRAGALSRPGRIEDGNTVCDFDDEEKRRGQSVTSAMVRFGWNGCHVNLIDAPGYADFHGEALAAMRVADLAVFVVDAVAGVQHQDVVLWRQAQRWNLPRLFFVNKLDHERAHFDPVVDQMRTRFGPGIEPVELPIGEESGFHGVAELLTEHAFLYDSGPTEETDVPDDLRDRERQEHDHLVEDMVETDDELLEQYLEGQEPSPSQLAAVLHRGIDQAKVFPVLCGSASKSIGVDRLAEFICRLGPAPGEAEGIDLIAGDTTLNLPPDPEADPLLYVFKTYVDRYLGQVSIFRVLSGRVRVDDQLVNSRTGVRERLRQLVTISGSSHQVVPVLEAGDIGAAAKLTDTATGDCLAPTHQPVRATAIDYPASVFGMAVRPRTPNQEDRLATGLQRVLVEDPTLRMQRIDETGQTVLLGYGETHLQVALAKIRRLGVEIETDTVKVAYRERLAGSCDVEGRHKKQTGGHGEFGVVNVRFAPLAAGGGYEFDEQIVGGAIPKALVPAVGKGIEESMRRGGRFGFPVTDLHAVAHDGKHHSVDSSEHSFKMAGAMAFRAALTSVGTEVLEPISEVAVTAPVAQQGEVMGDLSSRRGHLLGTEVGDSNDEVVVRALVPTSELGRYAIDLRSMTAGRGRYTVDHHGYEPLPDELVAKLASA